VIQVTPEGALAVHVHPLLVETSSVLLSPVAVAWTLVGLTS
jgi:hypothetical protein